jgi:hypothetical protein
MIRQVLSVIFPAAGTSPVDTIKGKWYGFRLAPPVAGGPTGILVVNVLRYDGATETLTINPLTDGWFWSKVPFSGIKATGLGAAAVVADLWYATDPGDLAVEKEPQPLGVEMWDSGIIPAGAQITSPVLDLRSFSSVSLYANNQAGAATRAFAYQAFRDDGVTVIYNSGPLGTIAAGAYGLANFGPSVLAASATLGFNTTLPNRAQFILAAGGAANGRLTVIAR